MRLRRYGRLAAGAALSLCLTSQVYASGSGSGMVDNDMLQELKRMIEQQQAQIDKQAAEIAALKEQLAGNTEAIGTKADKGDGPETDKMVNSSLANVNLSLYGHINKAALYGNNGDTSKWYIVDNTNSQTRFGLKASVESETGWLLGGRIEYGIVSNGSSDVNNIDNNNATSTNFKLRWAEVSLRNETYGTLSLGKGSSATDGTAEVDLSGTTVAAYSSIPDLAGSFLWYEGSTDTLSDLRIKDVFSNFDGLGRTDRIRYDTPSFAGFSLAGSAQSGDAFDAALLYSRSFNDTKVAAAFGVANPGDLIASVDTRYSGSASILFPMGFNLGFTVAYDDLKDNTRDDPTNWYAKLGYRTKFYDAATSSFSIDYGETADLRVNDEKAKTWSLAAVHNVIDWGTEFYLVYRYHQLDTDLFDFDNIHAFMTGARLKF